MRSAIWCSEGSEELRNSTLTPCRAASYGLLDSYRASIIAFTCPAGLAGLPQVNIPAGFVDGAPVGLSLLGPRGSDRALIALAEALTS